MNETFGYVRICWDKTENWKLTKVDTTSWSSGTLEVLGEYLMVFTVKVFMCRLVNLTIAYYEARDMAHMEPGRVEVYAPHLKSSTSPWFCCGNAAFGDLVWGPVKCGNFEPLHIDMDIARSSKMKPIDRLLMSLVIVKILQTVKTFWFFRIWKLVSGLEQSCVEHNPTPLFHIRHTDIWNYIIIMIGHIWHIWYYWYIYNCTHTHSCSWLVNRTGRTCSLGAGSKRCGPRMGILLCDWNLMFEKMPQDASRVFVGSKFWNLYILPKFILPKFPSKIQLHVGRGVVHTKLGIPDAGILDDSFDVRCSAFLQVRDHVLFRRPMASPPKEAVGDAQSQGSCCAWVPSECFQKGGSLWGDSVVTGWPSWFVVWYQPWLVFRCIAKHCKAKLNRLIKVEEAEQGNFHQFPSSDRDLFEESTWKTGLFLDFLPLFLETSNPFEPSKNTGTKKAKRDHLRRKA